MTGFCRSDEIVVGDIELLPERLETLHHFVTVRFGVYPPLLGRFLNLLTVLICASEKKNLISLQTLETGKDISGDGGVSMSDMGDIVHIIDRSGDVNGCFRFRMHGW
jgi:hypothetical protein